MKTRSILKLAAIFGMSTSWAHASKPELCDTTRVAHVRYTPECDYINLEKIHNNRPTEQYLEIISSQDNNLTMFGDTIIIKRDRDDKIMQIYNKTRNHYIQHQR